MPLSIDLSKTPYFATSNSAYYKVLFKPSVSVQTRELNELQLMLQRQVELLADNIFTSGTILAGCNFNYIPNYPYVKIKDVTADGLAALPSNYLNMSIRSLSTGLAATIVDTVDGFESSDPDLKTLYLRYINGGANGTTTSFAPADVLMVENRRKIIAAVDPTNGGSSFSNSDLVISHSALIVNVASGTFTNGEYITNNSANLQIIGLDTVTMAATRQVIVSVRPKVTDLANASSTASSLSFANNDSIRNVSNTVTGIIEGFIGSGFRGKIVTNNVGKITEVDVFDGGSQYTTLPFISVLSANNSAGLTSLNLTSRNYIDRVIVASTANAVGTGYAFGVSKGVIYQKGYMIEVPEQTIVVDKYSSAPDGVVVGFDTTEKTIDSNIDADLLDNAYTSRNRNAPGADRLYLMPSLVVLATNTAASNANFFTLSEWSEGQAFRQKQTTQYAKIGDEIARGISDQSGDFVVDPFLITTRSTLDANLEANTYSVVVDPGTAYINGYRVSTVRNFTINTPKGIDTVINGNQSVALTYGNYVKINNIGGTFQFATGDSVDLYDTAKTFLSNSAIVAAGNTNPVGTKIGTANMRNLVRLDDNGGYALYLFNILMNAGQNFRSVKAVYYNGTRKGIADVALDYDSTTNTNIANIVSVQPDSGLLFFSGVKSLKNANAITYQYRTIDQTLAVSNAGILTKDLSASVNEFFPYSASLNNDQLKQLFITPTVDLVFTNNVAGSTAVSSGNAVMVGTTTAFVTDLAVGDYVQFYSNGTANDIRRVISIANNTQFTVDSAVSWSNTTAFVYRAFPRNVVVPFGYRSGLSANVNANSNIMTINFGTRFNTATTSNVSFAVNVLRSGVTQSSKTPNRNRFVKLAIANNAGGLNGPWCVGVPDVFRMRNVYLSGNSTIDATSNNVTTNFFIDHNQTKDFLDLSYLYLKPKANVSITANSYLLVEFDHFTATNTGFYDAISYVSANAAQRYLVDSQPLANLSSTVNSFEIPEVVDPITGQVYDLIEQLDFRPIAVNTATAATVIASAPINPASNLSFGNTASAANDKKFPVPGTIFSATIEQFVGRMDSIVVDTSGKISVVSGRPNQDLSKVIPPDAPANSLKISDILVPPYPNITINRSNAIDVITRTNVLNERYLKNRLGFRTITRPSNNGSMYLQPKAYTMADIAKLEKRLKDVEYYVSLTLLESDIKNRVIPSSTDPSLDRFKYGFFVDGFDNYLYSDQDNPQYAAYIEDGCLVPEKITWTINFENILGGGPYIDELLVSQDGATRPIGDAVPYCIPSTMVANTLAFRLVNNIMAVGNNVVDVFNVQLASAQSAPVSLFFYAYDQPIHIEVYQNGNLIKTTAVATALTATEKTKVVSAAYSSWFYDGSAVYLVDPTVVGGTAKGCGKITWTHVPGSGTQYTIKVFKSSTSYRWRYILEYPINSNAIGCPIIGDPLNPSGPGYDYMGDGSRESVSAADFGLGLGDTSDGDSCGDSSGEGGGGGDGGGGSCFITTAVTEFFGAADDAYALDALRMFRDIFMGTEEGKPLVIWYYKNAPTIVALLEDNPDRENIYKTMLNAYIIPAVDAVTNGEVEKAKNIYISLVEWAVKVSGFGG